MDLHWLIVKFHKSQEVYCFQTMFIVIASQFDIYPHHPAWLLNLFWLISEHDTDKIVVSYHFLFLIDSVILTDVYITTINGNLSISIYFVKHETTLLCWESSLNVRRRVQKLFMQKCVASPNVFYTLSRSFVYLYSPDILFLPSHDVLL